MSLNVNKIRSDFPILNSEKPPIYLDSACMTLRPKAVIEKINEYYTDYPGCGGRSLHKIARAVTEGYDGARIAVQKFFNAQAPEDIVFTRNTTEAINLVSKSLGFGRGDVVLTTDREHNSNLIPWLSLSEKTGAIHKVVKSCDDNTFDVGRFEAMMNRNVKLVSMVHTSNFDGYTIPAKEIIKIAHDYDALVMLDGAQSAPHLPVDFKKLDVDFFACSGHKMLGPSGIGFFYGKSHLLEKLDAYNVGGETVVDSTYTGYTISPIPEKFEAGLQNYAGAIGFGAALEYLKSVGIENVMQHDLSLNRLMTEMVKDISGLKIIGPLEPEKRSGILSFTVDGISPHDIVMSLDKSYVMMRSGAHCVHSWFNSKGINGCARASVYIYNTEEDILMFAEALKKAVDFFKKG